jgi:precorrin-4 methylase
MRRGRVVFVGCGPGAPDLLTLRAAHALKTADVVIWNASLLARDALEEHVRPQTEIVRWPPATARDIVAVFDRAIVEALVVVRLKGGDPTLFGGLGPELAAVRERDLDWEIVPGISALGAAASQLGLQIARPGAPLVVAAASDLVQPTTGVVVAFEAGRRPAELERALGARGLAPETPCVVAVDVSRPDQVLASCRLDELAECIADFGLNALTIVVAGCGADTQ